MSWQEIIGLIGLGPIAGMSFIIWKFFLPPIKTEFKTIKNEIRAIREPLLAKGIITPLILSKSLKRVTEEGHRFLRDRNIDTILKDCELFQQKDQLKEKSNVDLYLECSNWIEKNRKKEILDIALNSNISQGHIDEIVTIYLMEQIRKD